MLLESLNIPLTNLICVSKKNYYCNLLDANKNNLKQTWKVLNGLLGGDRKKSFPDCFNINGTVIIDFKSITDGFNNFFTNIGPRWSNGIPDINVSPNHFLNNIPSPQNSLFFNPTDHDEVVKICASLKASASPGYDDIKPDVVKSVSHLLAYPLVHIFNLSMSTGFVPDQFKLAKVVPIYKTGDSGMCNNYRPISVLPVFSKIFECIINKRLCNYEYFTHQHLLHSSQFGFRSNFSSYMYMAVLEAYNNIISHLDKGEHTVGIFLDLSKAFDMISHDILLIKLHHYGVRGIALDWFRDYLTNRKQFVTFNNCKSNVGTVQFGVPQGSILSPLLFIIFLNDIVFASNVLSFFI